MCASFKFNVPAGTRTPARVLWLTPTCHHPGYDPWPNPLSSLREMVPVCPERSGEFGGCALQGGVSDLNVVVQTGEDRERQESGCCLQTLQCSAQVQPAFAVGRADIRNGVHSLFTSYTVAERPGTSSAWAAGFMRIPDDG
jgi:hypothetical protein